MNLELETTDYLIMSMYVEPEKERYINILLKVIDQNKMVGGHSITYASLGHIGSGTVVMVRQNLISSKDLLEDASDSDKPLKNEELEVPKSFLPFAHRSPNLLEQKIINFLSKNSNSLVVPPEYWELDKSKDTAFEGLYKMYSARKKPGQIKVSLLRIYRNGHVTHQDPGGDLAYGQMEIDKDAMTIIFRNAENRRTGFCCIGIESIPPRPGRSVYGGTFSGFTRGRDKAPVASKVFLEFIGKDEYFNESVKQQATSPKSSKLYKAKILEVDSLEAQNLHPKILYYFSSQARSVLYFPKKVYRMEDIEVPHDEP